MKIYIWKSWSQAGASCHLHTSIEPWLTSHPEQEFISQKISSKKYIRLYTPGLSYFFLWGLVTVHFLSGGRTINSKCCIKLNLTFSQSIKKFSMVISVCHMPSLNLDMETTTFFLKWDYSYTHLIHWPSDRLTRSTPLHYYAFRTSLTWLGET